MSDKIRIQINPNVADIFPDYLAHRKKDLITMRELLNQEKLNEIRVIGHKMKGGGKLYNLDMVTILGDKIEKAAIDMNKSIIGEALDELEDFFSRLEIM